MPMDVFPKCAINPEVQQTLEDIKRGKIAGITNQTIAALKAIEKCASGSVAETTEEFAKQISSGCCSIFIEAQPANISLSHAIQYLQNQVGQNIDAGLGVHDLKRIVCEKVEHFTGLLQESAEKIGIVGQGFINDGDTIFTHGCSTTVLSIVGNAHNNGKKIRVIVTEARPEFQGRLFAMAATDIGIPVRLIIDSATSVFMKQATKVFVGAIAVYPTGRVMAKVGTSIAALVARNANKPVYVAATTDRFSPERIFALISESDIHTGSSSLVFEQAHGIEVSNPLYDLTPPEQIDAIITQNGAIHPKESIRIIKEMYGDKPGLRDL